MILYDKAALTEKLGRKIAECIDVLLTPGSGEREVRGALEKLMRLDNGKLAYKYGNEPSEILLASAVGFLRLNCGSDEHAGAVAVDNINEAIRLDPKLDNDTVFRQEFIYELVKAGADQGDAALQAVLADLYTGDVVAPGDSVRLEADGMSSGKLHGILEDIIAAGDADNTSAEAVSATGISANQLLEELDWTPYEVNGYARARRFMQDGRRAEAAGDNTAAAELYFKAACLGNTEAASAYAALTSELFEYTEKKPQLKNARRCRKTLKKIERLRYGESSPAEEAALLALPPLDDYPPAMYERALALSEAGDEAQGLELLKAAADRGEPRAERAAAEYFGDKEHFDFNAMMRYLLLGLANTGNWAVYPTVLKDTFTARAEADNALSYELTGTLTDRLCRGRDMIDELEELSEPVESDLPELTTEQQEAVFMWQLCDPGSDARRQTLARLYSEGFGTPKDRAKAAEIWQELCEKYTDGAAEAAVSGDEGDEEATKPFIPCEAFYENALRLITAEGEARDVDGGKALLDKIPPESEFYQKAEKLKALTETETSELIRLGTMFHKEGNDDAMLKLYSCAEKLGDPAAARLIGRYYAAREGAEDMEEALKHLGLGAQRGDVHSMYLAGAALTQADNYDEVLRYFKNCAAAGGNSDDEEVRAVAARAMKDAAELYYSGNITGEKNVPRYLYWLERAEKAGYKLSDASVDKRRAAENYFKPAQWQELLTSALSGSHGDDDGFESWVIRTCAERKMTPALEELGVRAYKGTLADAEGQDPYAILRTPALSSPRAQYYTACCLYTGRGCAPDLQKAAAMLPSEAEFGDPEGLRNEIAGLAAYQTACSLSERRANEAPELLKKAETELIRALREQGRDQVLFELSDILIRAYDEPDNYTPEQLHGLWRKGYGYLMEGYQREARCTAQVDAFSPGRLVEIAALYEENAGPGGNAEPAAAAGEAQAAALSWYLLAADCDAAAQRGAGSIYLARAKDPVSGKVIDRDELGKARELIARAASAGDAGAELLMYKERKVFDIESDEARLNLKRAAVRGNEEARTLCKELEIEY
ncbi:MAG: sel1 repeat family protein [Clostridia bacterium]|nr:sel1 repeat family protein [Clostridia bacterium]